MNSMKLILKLLVPVIFLLAAGRAHASRYWFQGDFVADDRLEVFELVVSADSLVNAATFSFSGGSAFGGNPISAGGFAPVLSLFDSSGALQQLAIGSTSLCVNAQAGPCWDASLSSVLTSGEYTLVLTQDGNVPIGPSWIDGYLKAGDSHYTGMDFLGDASKQFINADGSQRTRHWALAIDGTNVTVSQVPEPISAVMLMIGLASISVLTRRRSRKVSSVLAAAAVSTCVIPGASFAADAVVIADTHVSTGQTSLNFGSLPQISVGGGSLGLLKFDLAHLPDGTSASLIRKANLILWVNRVGTAGTIEAQRIFSPWTESTVTASSTPTLGGAGSGIAFNVSAANQFVIVDVTAWVRDWVANPSSNLGLALVSSAGTQAFFESKEGGGRSARLDVTLADSAIAAGALCTGSGKVLQFDGSRFVCVNAQVSTTSYTHPDQSSAFSCAGAGWQNLTVTVKNDFFSGKTVTLSASNLRADYNWANSGFSASMNNAFPIAISYANGRDFTQLMVSSDGNLYGRCKTYTNWELMHSGLF